MNNAERLRQLLTYRDTKKIEVDHKMLIGSQVLRKLQSGESLLISRQRIESILKDLNELETIGCYSMGKYLYFDDCGLSASGKTKRFAVLTANKTVSLGIISWKGQWRSYVFYPQPSTVFDVHCLQEITSFIKSLREERRLGQGDECSYCSGPVEEVAKRLKVKQKCPKCGVLFNP
jgi:hypothetical protein